MWGNTSEKPEISHCENRSVLKRLRLESSHCAPAPGVAEYVVSINKFSGLKLKVLVGAALCEKT